MKLSALLGYACEPDRDIEGLSGDSRRIREGSLFAALPGSKADGRDFIADAIRRGAAAVLAPPGTIKPHVENLAWIEDPDPRRLFSRMAARFYGKQPGRIAAVTGTNGKTSSVNFAYQIWNKLSLDGASLGTLGLRAGKIANSGSMTTPDPVTLHANLADLAEAGITHLALEASSHGLHQFRLDGVKLKAAGFTNLTRDHLDYHATMDEYRSAKLRLFSELLSEDGTAVVNADAPEADLISKICADRKIRCWTYGQAGKDLKILDRESVPQGQKLKLEIMGRRFGLTLPLVGSFQAMNVLCAAGLAAALDEKRLDEIIDALPLLDGVPGRLQFVPGHPKNAAVYVDYAHTPDALENILSSLRPHAEKRLVCLFGCGGDRDSGKRALMGQVASRLSDLVIVTDDNPRTEDPAAIRASILEGAPDALEIGGRRNAIRQAVSMLEAGDILVIAGKGHEQGQIFADRVEPFDDVNEAHSAMQEAS